MIKSLTPDELPFARKCAEQFFFESRLPGRLNFEHWVKEWTKLINSGIGEVFAYVSKEAIEGILGVMYYPCTMTGDLEALEGFWFMMPDFRGGPGGIRMLKRFEEEAQRRGCKRIKMVHLMSISPKEMENMYIRMGYNVLQVHYVKEILA